MKFVQKHFGVNGTSIRRLIREAAATSGKAYELGVMSNIQNGRIPILREIEAETGIPVVSVSFDKSRGRQSGQSEAVVLWQKGHIDQVREKRVPDATIEFIGRLGVVERVSLIEISLMTDLSRPGNSASASMSRAKSEQLALTTALLVNKPSYKDAKIDYWYVAPWEPSPGTEANLLLPMQKMVNTDRVQFTWATVDHREPAQGAEPSGSRDP